MKKKEKGRESAKKIKNRGKRKINIEIFLLTAMNDMTKRCMEKKMKGRMTKKGEISK